MKSKEEIKRLRGLDEKSLSAELDKVSAEYGMANLKVKAGKLDDISLVSKLKKNIARIHTIMTEKELGEENGK